MRTGPDTFRSSGAVVFGGITVISAFGLAVLAAIHPNAGAPGWISAALVLLALVVYVAQVRPAVVLEESDLVLRNMLESVHVPWPVVGEVRVRQFLTVEVGDRSYDCAAVGRSRRQVRRDNREIVANNPAEQSFGRFVETKIRNRAAEARRRRTPEAVPEHLAMDDGVRRVRAWPEIVLLVASMVALVVTIFI